MRRLLPLVLLLTLAGAAQAEDKPDPKEIARLKAEMALRARIPKAVDRAVAWIWKQQQEDGSFLVPHRRAKSAARMSTSHVFGKTALTALALVHAGVEPDDERLAKALRYLRKNWRGMTKGNTAYHGATYSLSILAMLLHTLAEKYATPPEGASARTNPAGLPARDLTIVRLIGRWLLRTRVPDSLFSYPAPTWKMPAKVRRKLPKGAPAVSLHFDMSNTQYALLGLWACARCGVEIPSGALESISEALLKVQARSGPAVKRRLDPSPGDDPGAHVYAGLTDRARGFPYAANLNLRTGATMATGSMTAGGLSSLLIVKAILREQGELEDKLGRRLDRGIWDAIAWLDKYYAIDENPSSMDLSGLPVEQAKLLKKHAQMPDFGGYHHRYYLYGLERAMVIGGKRFIGEHDWYLDGARFLLGIQAEDGHWPKPSKKKSKPPLNHWGSWPLVDTCFAVLFLKRATLRPRAPLIQTRKTDER